jgi:hypothetical protein
MKGVQHALHVPTWRRLSSSLIVVLLLAFVPTFVAAEVAAQVPKGAQLLVVSKPPASLLPTDPAQGLVYTAPPDLTSSEVFFNATGGPVALVYLTRDSAGNGYLTFEDGPDPVSPGGLMVVTGMATRANKTFDAERDHVISGRAVGLSEPKDLILVEDQGLLIVADFASANIKVFPAHASGNIAPEFTAADLGSSAGNAPRRPWGLAYDDASDRLFVGATDGALLVYDAFLASAGARGPDRVVHPTLGGARTSHNLHELIYLPERDIVVVTDVGAATTSDQPGFDSDGALLVIEAASRARGPTPVRLRLAGPASLLGNPVSLARQGETIFVADNGLDLILRFDGLLERRGALERAPDAALSIVKPESILFIP